MSIITTDKEYYQDKEYITNSMIGDLLNKGEYYYYLKHIKKVKEPFFSRDYFDFGKAIDAFCDGGLALFQQIVHIVSKRTGNVPEGHVELTESAGKQAKGCIEEIQNQPLIRYYNTGEKQKILQVEDFMGCKVKTKMDCINVEDGFISDTKTAANIENFEPQQYQRQLALYGAVAEMVYGKRFRLLLLVVDKFADFPRSEVYEMSDETRQRAMEEITSALRIIKDRMEFDTWAIPVSRAEIYKSPLYKEMPNYKIKEPTIF